MNYLKNYRPRPKCCGPPEELSAKGDSSSGGPQHRGADSLVCRPERYDTDVLLTNSYFKGSFKKLLVTGR